MAKFRKKPIVVEAICYDGTRESAEECARFMGSTLQPRHWVGGTLGVRTLEGFLVAYAGDWIIRGVKGEFYPCKPDIFEATYEPVEEASGERGPLPGMR